MICKSKYINKAIKYEGLNNPLCHTGFKKKTLSNYMQSVGKTLLIQRYKQIKMKWIRKNISCKQQSQESWSLY